MFKKFKNRKYLIVPPGKSNFTSYDLKLLMGMFFANLSLTVVAIMYIGSYWSRQTDSYKEMAGMCALSYEFKKLNAGVQSDLEMREAQNQYKNQKSIGVKIEPVKKTKKPFSSLIKKYNEFFLNK